MPAALSQQAVVVMFRRRSVGPARFRYRQWTQPSTARIDLTISWSSPGLHRLLHAHAFCYFWVISPDSSSDAGLAELRPAKRLLAEKTGSAIVECSVKAWRS